mgnify:FL=1
MPPKPQPRHPVQGTGRGAGALLQFKLTLTGIRPPIWRRVLVPEGWLLSGLHDVIQAVMGWTDSHLHDFHWREERFGIPDPKFDEERMVDERTVTLKELGLSIKDRLEYMYDFGDEWEHVLTLEKVLEAGEHQTPVCLKGARSCPPEDCGGAWGTRIFWRFSRTRHTRSTSNGRRGCPRTSTPNSVISRKSTARCR